jgi:hypothetical protein
MLRTESEIAKQDGRQTVAVPAYRTWERELLSCEPDMQAMADAVQNELMRGLFRAGAAASGKNQQEE